MGYDDIMTKTIKDFIYLDDGRVRSYLAQIDGKLTGKIESKSAHNLKADGGVKAEGITRLFLDTKASAGYAFEKSNSETSTLHHAAFELLKSKLHNTKLVNAKGSKTRPFSDIACRLRLVDYSVLANQLSQMGLLMPLFDKIAGNKTSQNNRATAKQMKDMAEAIKLLYGDSKILQLIDVIEDKVIAQASLDNSLSIPVQNLFQSSSDNILPGTWHVFCLHEQEIPVIELPTGNSEISEALSTVAKEIKNLKNVISATADADNIIPVAIYRELK